MPTDTARRSERAAPLTIAALIATVLAVSLAFLDPLEADAAPAHGRAWELVTPPDPNGVPAVSTLAIDATGDRIAYLTLGAPPDAPAGTMATANLATRGAGGWSGKPVGNPYSVPVTTLAFPFPVGASRDLSTWIWSAPMELLPGAPTTPDSGVYRGTTDGGLTLLGNGGNIGVPLNVVGMSEDAQRFVFQTPSQLLPADAGRTSGDELYEYVDTTLRMVAVDDGGAPLSTCGSIGGSASSPPNPVSRDGRRIFFTSPGGDCAGQPTRVYLREDETATTEISMSQCTRVDCNAPADVRFMGATPDGSRAFLATAQQLTDDDVDESQDLYRYDLAGGTLSRISTGPPGVGADVVATRAYSSDDGDRVFFLANGALVPGEGTTGTPNVYVADGEGVRFVASLDPADDWPAGVATETALQEVVVTPGGERLMFVTVAALTADDTDASRDAYLYDAENEALTLVSGAAGTGNGAFDVEVSLSDVFTYPPFPLDVPEALSEDGRHVIFTTAEALLPADVDAVRDVYEWFDGELGLISSGTGTREVFYLGTSADARTTFLVTGESLVPGDDDGGDHDLYAARVGGGFPEPPPPPPPGCDGDACFPPPPGRLTRPQPASLNHKSLVLRHPGAAARRRMVRSGRLRLVVGVPERGQISARASARIGDRRRTVAGGRATAARPGRVALRLRLSKLARHRLASGRALAVRVVLHHSRLDRASAIRFTLKGVK